jgi:hypothetical protein
MMAPARQLSARLRPERSADSLSASGSARLGEKVPALARVLPSSGTMPGAFHAGALVDGRGEWPLPITWLGRRIEGRDALRSKRA